MIVVVGESLIDIVVTPDGTSTEEVGGAPLNVATTIGRLDAPAVLLTQVGEDDRGQRIVEHLANAGVELVAAPLEHTPTATARLGEDGSATYDFSIDWTLPSQALPHCDAVYVGGLGTLLEPGRTSVLDLVDQAYGRDVAVCYDPNIRAPFVESPDQVWRDLESLADHCTVVKLSDQDVELLHPGADPEDIARSLLAGDSTELVVLTRGADGSTAYVDGCEISVPTAPVTVVDTVGAGDAFMGGLLTTLLESDAFSGYGAGIPVDPTGLTRLLTAASQVAAITCSRRGAQPPARPELPSSWPD